MSTPEEISATPDNQPGQSEEQTPSAEELLEIERKRRKDTQSAYTKGQQTIKALEAENAKLLELLSSQNRVVIGKDDQERLDNLKYEDPDAWRAEISALENKALSETRAKIASLTGEVKVAAEQQFELERRQQVLEEFNASSDVQITEALIADEVPPRITKKLAEGTITFEDFLQEVATYVSKGKTVKNEDVVGHPNLSDLGGGNTPSGAKAEKSIASQYKKDTY